MISLLPMLTPVFFADPAPAIPSLFKVQKNFDSGESENPLIASNSITTVAQAVSARVYDRCHHIVNFGKSLAILPVREDKTV